MTLLFGICLAVGAVAVLFSLLAGGDHAADAHADVHVDTQADSHADHQAHAGPQDHSVGDFWLLFLSLRFWVFFLTFFGLTGLALELAGASTWFAFLLALPTGLGLGLGAAAVFRRLREQNVSSTIMPEDMLGAEARVMLPVGGGTLGKVRLQLRGMIVDRVAFTEGEGVIARGDRVLVIAVRGEKLLVSKAPTPELGDGRNDGTGRTSGA
jgi:membrane protein implicated in regulation of membrane protease activity